MSFHRVTRVVGEFREQLRYSGGAVCSSRQGGKMTGKKRKSVYVHTFYLVAFALFEAVRALQSGGGAPYMGAPLHTTSQQHLASQVKCIDCTVRCWGSRCWRSGSMTFV